MKRHASVGLPVLFLAALCSPLRGAVSKIPPVNAELGSGNIGVSGTSLGVGSLPAPTLNTGLSPSGLGSVILAPGVTPAVSIKGTLTAAPALLVPAPRALPALAAPVMPAPLAEPKTEAVLPREQLDRAEQLTGGIPGILGESQGGEKAGALNSAVFDKAGKSAVLEAGGPVDAAGGGPGPGRASEARRIFSEQFEQAPDSYRAALAAAHAPKVELSGVLSTEGSGAILFDAVIAGHEAAVKTYKPPMKYVVERQGLENAWAERLEYFHNEILMAREAERILGGRGMAPRVYGEVDLGGRGNPSWAMEKVRGKMPEELTPAELDAIVTPRTLRQAAEALRLLNEQGLGGGDSPQLLILTEAQTINGVPRRPGDVVFIDPGGITADRSIWKTPRDMAGDVAYVLAVREVVPGLPAGQAIAEVRLSAAQRAAVRAAKERILDAALSEP